jgi:two-component system sensor histidine kinase ResE
MAKTEERRAFFYNNIVREALRLSRLVDDLLELSRLQSSAEAMQKTRFDLREVFKNVSDSFSHAAAEAAVLFITEADMEHPIYVFSNPDRIEQVLVIILDNAVKHTPAGGAVTLTSAAREGKIEVCVSNTGEGIPPEDLPYIFERFYKADKSHSGGGTGLGLSIAMEIMKDLGESIRAESAGSGASFIFTLSLP